MQDRRPRKENGQLYEACKICHIEQHECKGFCIFQRIEKEAEQEMKRRNQNE